MKTFIYKAIISLITIVLVYEFTLGKQIKKYSDRLDYFSTKEGRKELIVDLREEVKKGVNKERYLSKEDARLLNKFFKKIQKELNESED